MTARRRDANEAAIVSALQAVGCVVVRLEDRLHAGLPDLLVCRPNGEVVLLEVKTATGRIKKEQYAFIGMWSGGAYVVRTVTEALAAVGVTG